MEIQERQYNHHKDAWESILKEKNFLLMLLQIQVQAM